MTRLSAILLAVGMAAHVGHAAGQSVELEANSVDDHRLVEILNSAALTELDRLQPEIEKSVSLRLYEIERQGSCVEDTHWVCSHEYYLAISEWGEYPTQAVYALGTVGEISSVEWLPLDDYDRALLRVTVASYPQYAVGRQPDLEVSTRVYELDVTVGRLLIR